jgi:sugar phosphate isomerase/epimerase
MNLGIIHYNAPGKTLEEFLKYAADTGFGFVELQIRDVWPEGCSSPEKEAESAARLVQQADLKVSALAASNDFVVLDDAEVKAQAERMKRVCGLAKLVGCSVIRTEGGSPKDSVPKEKWADAIAGCLKRCREFIEPMNIRLAIDNHGQITNEAGIQKKIIMAVDSPNVGVNLDTMNYRWFGHDLQTIHAIYEEVAPSAFHTHLKDGTGSRQTYVGAALGDGEIELAWAVECLKKAGYAGVWCAEYEGREDTGIGYAKCLKWMKANT